ncbi:MAG: hypothetical protein WDN69_11925 [Aliidongia sp.]
MPAYRHPALLSWFVIAVAIVVLGQPANAGAQSITEFPLPIAGSSPFGIAAGPDGALWFTEYTVNGVNGAPNTASKIGRIATTGEIIEFPLPTAAGTPQGIVAGPDGALWFYEAGDEGGTPAAVPPKIGRITLDGAITEFTIPLSLNTAGPFGAAIAVGPDGALWFTVGFDDSLFQAVLGRITTDGTITEYTLSSAAGLPVSIAAGPDGALWLALQNFAGTSPAFLARITPADAASGGGVEYPVGSAPFGVTAGPDGALWFTSPFTLGRITTAGTLSELPYPPAGGPNGIAAGPDGALWFVEIDEASLDTEIGRITTGGTHAEFAVPTAGSVPQSIVAGPDGAMWFTEFAGGRIGRVAPLANTSPLVAAVLPLSRSVQAGSTATAFASVINSGSSPVESCIIAPVNGVPANFLFQATDPASNALTGTANMPVAIPAGGSQSFFVAFATNAPFVPVDTVLGFDCAGTDAAASVAGLNTLLLSGSTGPVPDVIALSATPSGDGILDIAGPAGSAGFAVATANAGAAGSITATPDTGSAILPLSLTMCETDPSTSQCLAPPSSTVSGTIEAGATRTYSVFAAAEGDVALVPSTSRIFVRFTDSEGEIRGTTSVAVRTQ